MRLTSPLRARVVLLSAITVMLSCDKKVEKEQVPSTIAQFFAMRNPVEAPEAIRAASAVVVRIESERGGWGTGAFITDDGLLLTNNHVMGVRLCATEGCFFYISLSYEAGSEYRRVKVFGKPIFASVDLDAAVLQLHHVSEDGQPSGKFAAPNSLQFEPASSSDLIGKKVFIVGHPHGGLKKWAEGEAYRDQGKWFYSTHFTLPGNSGSPVLNENGRIVGILHRGSDDVGNITQRDLQTFAVSTSSAAILAAYNPEGSGALPNGLFLTATDEAVSAQTAAADEEIYFNAHIGSVKLDDGTEKSLIDIVGAACDASLAKETVQSLEELESDLEPCYAAVNWLSCNDPTVGKTYKTCPSDDAAKAEWRSRFSKAAAKVHAFNGKIPYYWRIDAPADLEAGEALMLTSGKSALSLLVEELGVRPNFTAARYAAAYASIGEDPTIGETTVSAFLRSYDSQPHYEYFAADIVRGLGLLRYNEILSEDEQSALYKKLLNDPKISVRDRLLVERYAYQWGVL